MPLSKPSAHHAVKQLIRAGVDLIQNCIYAWAQGFVRIAGHEIEIFVRRLTVLYLVARN
jgi:hypothetical protein